MNFKNENVNIRANNYSPLPDILSLISGGAMTLAFAPFDIYIFSLLSPAVLLLIWLYSTPKQAFWHGLLFGMAWFTGGIYWVYISVHTYGFASFPIAALTAFLLIFALSFFTALQGCILNRFFPQNNLIKLMLVFPLTWALIEWLKTWVLSGFPWLLLGYSQLNAPLRNIAPIFGVYGVSFFTALTCGALVSIFCQKMVIQRVMPMRNIFAMSIKANNRLSKKVAVSIVAMVWVGCWLLGKVNWVHPVGNPIKVSLIQANIPQEIKWQRSETQTILKCYYRLISQRLDSDIIILPEGALPMFESQAKPFIKLLDRKALNHKTVVIFGIGIDDQKNHKYYNGMKAVGISHSTYLKRKLVPFGEYQPLSSVTELFMNIFSIPMSSFTPGPKRQSEFLINKIKVAPSICYETAYPNLQLPYLPAAQLLINITDDSWFGKSLAAEQQLQIGRMRSLEAGRYQIVATNNGVTAIIKPDGKVQSKAPVFQEYVLTDYVYAMNGTTPWVKFGHYLWLVLTFGGIFLCWRRNTKSQN